MQKRCMKKLFAMTNQIDSKAKGSVARATLPFVILTLGGLDSELESSCTYAENVHTLLSRDSSINA